MALGGARPGAGRKPKGFNRLRKESELKVEWQGLTPAQLMQQIVNDETLPMELRLEAARAGAIYVHRKQPTATEITGGLDITTKRIVLDGPGA